MFPSVYKYEVREMRRVKVGKAFWLRAALLSSGSRFAHQLDQGNLLPEWVVHLEICVFFNVCFFKSSAALPYGILYLRYCHLAKLWGCGIEQRHRSWTQVRFSVYLSHFWHFLKSQTIIFPSEDTLSVILPFRFAFSSHFCVSSLF